MEHQRRFLIIGAGYSAQAFAREKPTADFPISGTTRSEEKFARLREAGIAPLLFAGQPNPQLRAALDNATHLIVSAGPDEAGDPALNGLGGELRAVAGKNLRWIGYLSTVGVYGDHGGAWVDETTPTRPKSRRSVERAAAEDAWMAFAAEAGIPLAILRLSGIYGPGRNAFLNLQHGTAKRLVKPGQVFNRIHVADISGALWLLSDAQAGGIFNVTDDEPAPPQDVVTYAANLVDVEPPPQIDFDTADLSPMQRSFYGENKRVENAKLKAAGYAFRFPDYRKALSAMWADGSWAGETTDARSPMRSTG